MHDNSKVKPLHIILQKASAYLKRYDGHTKWIYFMIEDDDLLEKDNTSWNKVSADIKKSLIASLSLIVFFLKTKIKPHDYEVTDFYNQQIPKMNSNHTCLVIISLDSALKRG